MNSIKLFGWVFSLGLVLVADSIPHAAGDWNVSGALSFIAGWIFGMSSFYRLRERMK